MNENWFLFVFGRLCFDFKPHKCDSFEKNLFSHQSNTTKHLWELKIQTHTQRYSKAYTMQLMDKHRHTHMQTVEIKLMQTGMTNHDWLTEHRFKRL